MSEEKRMADNYEIVHAIHIGDKEVVFGIDEKQSKAPYMCGYYSSNVLFGCYEDCIGSGNYIEIVKLFAERVQKQVNKIQAEKEKVTVPLDAITAEQCHPNNYEESIEGKIVAIKTTSLRPEYQTADRQIVLVTGGFGSHANSRGRAVNTINLYSGKESRWNREDIQGEIKELPKWAKERLPIIQAESARKNNITEKSDKEVR